MITEQTIREFVAPFYVGKDMMHDLTHIDRVLKKAYEMAEIRQVDREVLLLSGYFHGIIGQHKEAISAFLEAQGYSDVQRNYVLSVAEESDKAAHPVTMEGKTLHDAHLLEGGEVFGIIKSLITGSIRGQSLEESMDYYESYLSGQYKCVLKENFKAYSDREAFAHMVIAKLSKEI